MGGWILAAPLLIFVCVLFIYPAFSVLRTSVLSGEEINSGGFSLEHYVAFFSAPLYVKAMVNTLTIAIITTLVTGVLGLIYAYRLTVCPGLRQLQLGLISVNDILTWMGVIASPLALNYSFTGIIIALVMFQFPFMTMAIYASLSRLDTTLVEAAETLGADRVSVVLHVIFPLAVPGLVAGSVLTFAASAGTFIVPAMMGGGMINTVPQMIYSNVSQSLQWATASAFAVILVVILVVPILMSGRLADRDTAESR